MYPNLTEQNIQHTTNFFNSLDVNNTGLVTVEQICNRCDIHAQGLLVIDETAPKYPDWIYNFQRFNGFNLNSEITETTFLELGQNYEEMQATEQKFQEIDSDGDGIILFSDILEFYKLPPVYIPQTSPTHEWIENLKLNEDLSDNTELTLSDLLFYENKYNTMHVWIID